MNKYDCASNYPCKHDTFFSPKSVYRHIDPTKFIYCIFWSCEEVECPEEMFWFQDIHRCLIAVDYEKLKGFLNVVEEKENHTEHIHEMKFGFYNKTIDVDFNTSYTHEDNSTHSATSLNSRRKKRKKRTRKQTGSLLPLQTFPTTFHESATSWGWGSSAHVQHSTRLTSNKQTTVEKPPTSTFQKGYRSKRRKATQLENSTTIKTTIRVI
ncbi:hypothetical protein HELRODRAFT_171653 [Helobdella robusta]|uniref:Chitin-binding type-2 domain-containing protein n=1 Tax=Helobdella robusta TaxID=6412 RepID=T1F4I6_HELRO|nr:hypothetical protein HELRODRAFT_171653 [Helobdella robusta]ESO05290.1 hypothetical protein HELRODRAFT_171653 [Helobdella robusta]